MKLVWCPEMASKAFLDVVNLLKSHTNTTDNDFSDTETDLAELVAALAGGWNAQCILQILPSNSPSSSSASLALSAAASLTGGRHLQIMESDGADMVPIIDGMDFALVDFERSDAVRVLRMARVGPRGAVLVCKNKRGGGGRETESVTEKWTAVMVEGTRLVRSVFLPIGRGVVEIVHVGVGEGKSLSTDRRKITNSVGSGRSSNGRWIKHVDRITGEEHLFRR